MSNPPHDYRRIAWSGLWALLLGYISITLDRVIIYTQGRASNDWVVRGPESSIPIGAQWFASIFPVLVLAFVLNAGRFEKPLARQSPLLRGLIGVLDAGMLLSGYIAGILVPILIALAMPYTVSAWPRPSVRFLELSATLTLTWILTAV